MKFYFHIQNPLLAMILMEKKNKGKQTDLSIVKWTLSDNCLFLFGKKLIHLKSQEPISTKFYNICRKMLNYAKQKCLFNKSV